MAQIYGNILLAHENLEILASYINDINNQRASMASSVKYGIMLQSNLDILDAEILKTEQKQIEAKSGLKVLCEILSLLINKNIDENTSFADIAVDISQRTDSIKRPELKLYTLQENMADKRLSLAIRKKMPRLSVFGDGAYGRPGYNFLNKDMRFYGIAGISLTWNITGLYNLSFEKRNRDISLKLINTQRELFNLNLKTVMAQQAGEIDKVGQVIGKDKSIVEKRQSIARTYSNQLDNGLITSTAYLTELNAEKQAEFNQRMHEIQLGINSIIYSITTGY